MRQAALYSAVRVVWINLTRVRVQWQGLLSTVTGSTKHAEFIDWTSGYQLFKDCAPEVLSVLFPDNCFACVLNEQ